MNNTVEKLAGNWHVVAAVLIHKQGLTEARITEDDLKAFAASGKTNIVANDTKADGLRLILVDDAGAAGLVIKHAANGKLP